MVKLQRGNKNSKPRPLFPPGELPLFGPPPAFARRPSGPPPPRPRPVHHGCYGPPGPPPPMPIRHPPPLIGGPKPPMPPHPMRRLGPPGPPMPPPPPLMGLPRPPMGPPPFMRGPPRRHPGPPRPGPHPPPFRGRIDKMTSNRRFKPNNKVKKKKNNKKPESKPEELDSNILNGLWINDAIKAEIDVMNSLKKNVDDNKEKDAEAVAKYNEQKKKVEELAQTAKNEHLNSKIELDTDEAQKTSITEKEDEGGFLCEPCDRSWFTAEELEEHLSSHELCGVDGCSFSAHPKIVALHYKLQHASGLFEKIPKTYDAKDIAAWIAERKKRYPTKEKVEEKEAALKEKIERGEVLELPTSQPKLSAKPKDIRSKRAESKSNTNSPRNRSQRWSKPPRSQQLFIGNLQIEVVDGLPPDYETNKREAAVEREKALAAAEEAKNQEDDFISEDDWEVDNCLKVEIPKAMSSVLSALSAAYDSNISDDDGPPIEQNTVVSRALDEEKLPEPVPEPIDASQKLKGETANGPSMSRKRVRKRPMKDGDKKPRSQPPAPSSLLQMLLANDIRKERNQVLQCVRFIVENEYFDYNRRDHRSKIDSTPISVL